MSVVKVVVDTNVWVSATRQTRGPSAQLLNAWLKDRFQLIMSPAILAEHRRVLVNPRVRRGSALPDDEVKLPAQRAGLLKVNGNGSRVTKAEPESTS
jgi:predicted nucleic acid-binding protein